MKHLLTFTLASILISPLSAVQAGTLTAPPSAAMAPLPQNKPFIPQEFGESAPAPIGTPVSEPTFSVSRKGDLTLSCTELVHEAKAMSLVIENTKRIKDNTEFQSNGVTAAGAVGSLLIGTATGGIGLAVGGLLLDHNIEGRKDAADDIQDIAEQRRTFMMGIHKAKDCDGDIKAMIKDIPQLPDKESDVAQVEPAAGFDVPPMNVNDRYND